MQVDFYHLTTRPLEQVLPRICERVLADGGRLLIVATDEAQRAALDRLLWSYSADSFLPHGQLAASSADEAQPILLAPDVNAANRARHIALADGEWRDDALDFDRAFFFFDEARLTPARAAWKALADRDGVERRYWKQNDQGRWEQAA